MTEANRRQVVTVQITVTVDARGAELLPGWPGTFDCGDQTTAPLTGLEMTFQDLAHRALNFIEEEAPTVLGVRWVNVEVDVGPEFDVNINRA